MKSHTNRNRAVFLDRDGVLVEDVDWLSAVGQIRILEGVPQALRRLKEAGFLLLVVTNQPIIARGLATEAEIERVNTAIAERLAQAGMGAIDRFYFCPHHPKATIPSYRLDCQCRKPRPGMILKGAEDFAVDLSASFLVGDRITDIMAGAKAGCRTVQVQTGKHLAPMIQSAEPLDAAIKPDWTCADLAQAAEWILARP